MDHGWTPPSELECAGLPLQQGWRSPGSQLSRRVWSRGARAWRKKHMTTPSPWRKRNSRRQTEQGHVHGRARGNPPRMALAFGIQPRRRRWRLELLARPHRAATMARSSLGRNVVLVRAQAIEARRAAASGRGGNTSAWLLAGTKATVTASFADLAAAAHPLVAASRGLGGKAATALPLRGAARAEQRGRGGAGGGRYFIYRPPLGSLVSVR